MKAYQYRLYPTGKQEKAMLAVLDACRFLWNHCLAQRKTAYEKDKKTISCFTQIKAIPVLAVSNPFLREIYSQTAQDVPRRLDKAFRAFFRRVKAGEKPGYPRFKGKGWYNSFTYPQANGSFGIDDDGKLYLSKIGHVKIAYHRPVQGVLKTCVVKRSSTGKWYVVLTCDEVVEPKLSPSSEQVGIDMGLETFSTLSNGEKIANPRFFKREQDALAKVQRKFSKQAKGTPERKRARKVVSKVHERIANKRENFVHQESRKLVNRYGLLAFEDLNVRKMMEKYGKSIGDAAWSSFLGKLSYKAESAGRTVLRVNPAYTSQTCSQCGNRQKIDEKVRVYQCPICGLVLHRDLNASINILRAGLCSLATQKVA